MIRRLIKIERYIRAFRLAKKAFGNYKKQIVALLGLGFLGGLLEGIGVNAIIPLFSFLDRSEEHTSELQSH